MKVHSLTLFFLLFTKQALQYVIEIQASSGNKYDDVKPFPNPLIPDASLVSWQYTQYAACGDNQTAQVILGKNQFTNILQITQWGFNISSYSLIQSIKVSISRFSDDLSTLDFIVALIKSPTILYLAKTPVSNLPWSENYQNITYPLQGQDTLWGTPWAPSDINSPNFGISFQAYKISGTDDYAFVECVTIQVTYVQCLNDCNYPNGACNYTLQKCNCRFGYSGDDCGAFGVSLTSTISEYSASITTTNSRTTCTKPCLHGGKCIPQNDTCDCTNTEFTGVSCADMDPLMSSSSSTAPLGTKTVKVSAIISMILLCCLVIAFIVAGTAALWKKFQKKRHSRSPHRFQDTVYTDL